MPDPVILMPPSRNLEPDVVAIARQMLPPGFELRLVSGERLADELRHADYLLGFIGLLDGATLAGARRLKLVQLLSVGYARAPRRRRTRRPLGGAAAADHPLLSTPNTVLTPHVAGPTW